MTNQVNSSKIRIACEHAELDAVCSWPSEAARSWTLAAVDAADHDTAIDAIVGTGSAVREVDRSDDLDLVLVYSQQRPSLPRPPLDVDLRHYERADVPRMLAAGHDYISWTVRFGRPLFERNQWWTALQAKWNDRLALPSASEARARARKTERIYKEMLAAGDHDAASELEVSLLTHLARAALSEASVYPESRPELSHQLREIDQGPLADRLDAALDRRLA
jgi:hypothetical protein